MLRNQKIGFKRSPTVRSVGGWIFFHGIHVERGATDLFGRARECCRRSTENSEQLRCSGHRDQSALLYPFNDPGQLPIKPLREPNGERLRLSINFPDGKLSIGTWQAQVGRTKLYLLDTNDPANTPVNRGMTTELYGGGPGLRLRQEMVLGIGSWRLLTALGIQPELCHLNEGHAALAVLERARSYLADNRKPFDHSRTITRAGNLFTTHTPVEAGFDRFAPGLRT